MKHLTTAILLSISALSAHAEELSSPQCELRIAPRIILKEVAYTSFGEVNASSFEDCFNQAKAALGTQVRGTNYTIERMRYRYSDGAIHVSGFVKSEK